MSNKVKTILIISLILLLFGGVIVFQTYKDYMFPNPEGTIGNTAGNLNNGGLFCQVDDKIYFSNAYDDNRLYVMNLDETGMKCLTDSPVSYINADRHNVYYYINNIASVSGMGGFSVSVLGLYRTDVKGNKTKCMEKVTCGTIQLIDNDLYYQRYDNDEGVTLQKMDVRSKKRDTVLDFDANPACVSQGRIYYTGTDKDRYLYALDLVTKSTSTVCEVNAWAPDCQNGYIYYMSVDDNYCLYRFHIASGETEKLTSDRCDTYIYCNDYIIYQKNSQTAPALMMMQADGSNPVELAKGNYTGLSAVNGVVYFTEFGVPTPMYKCPVAGGGNIQIFQAAEDAALKKKK